MRLAEYITVLRALWLIASLVRRKPSVLRPGFVGMRGQWSYLTMACKILSTPGPPDSITQMYQNQAIHYLKAIDDTNTTVNIGTATQLWGCEILCNLQHYMNKYRQQYKSTQEG